MMDAANSPDPLPDEDDTVWPEHDPDKPDETGGEGEDLDAVVEENTAVLGSPD